ncbi:MAG: transglycosylase SLT domain-containing protein [Pseudobdellovibrio sp.]
MKKTTALMLLLAILSSSVSDLQDSAPIFHIQNTIPDAAYLKFQDHSESRLPLYKSHFKKYSDKYDIPWTLIAAVAYQESKWDEDAVSHTGVRGLMQLTTKTAAHVGVEDRADPFESIRGGAYYLKYLYNKTPKKLNDHQRWVLALSAYNIGWGHLRDAHRLALRLKKNPYNWSEFKKVLPLLEEEKYYNTLNYGFARGNETVDFVNKVFNYYNLLNTTFRVQSELAQFNYSK